jgi:hypothetical protein
MPKSSPEKLAKALRANLKKRKSGAGANAASTPEIPGEPPKKTPHPSEKRDLADQ